MTTLNVRAATPPDASTIKQLALDNGMFALDELGDFDEMLTGYFDGTLPEHRWIVAVDDRDVVVGAAYVAPEPFADRMWNLYFIATDPERHGSGAGTALLGSIEAELSHAGPASARTLIVDTSSVDGYEGARRFYAQRGFVEEARVRDFYGPGDDKVTFWKPINR